MPAQINIFNEPEPIREPEVKEKPQQIKWEFGDCQTPGQTAINEEEGN